MHKSLLSHLPTCLLRINKVTSSSLGQPRGLSARPAYYKRAAQWPTHRDSSMQGNKSRSPGRRYRPLSDCAS